MNHTRKNATFSSVFALLLSASFTVHALPLVPLVLADDSAYGSGTKAMDEHRWVDAVTAFDRVVDAKGKKADAALYWKAYSLNKLGNGPLALATCYQLRSHYSASPWNKDCSALGIELRSDVRIAVPPVPPVPAGPFGVGPPSGGGDGHPHGSDADLKILALNSLLNRDPAQAVPLLRGILTGDQPSEVKKHAIFVLAQSKSPEAQSILRDVVMGKMGPDLQRQGIQMSAIFEGKRANDSLAEVYRTTTDREVKRSVISAFFITQDAPRMVDMARGEKDLEMKRSIVSQLALMQDKAATDYMLELLK